MLMHLPKCLFVFILCPFILLSKLSFASADEGFPFSKDIDRNFISDYEDEFSEFPWRIESLILESMLLTAGVLFGSHEDLAPITIENVSPMEDPIISLLRGVEYENPSRVERVRALLKHYLVEYESPLTYLRARGDLSALKAVLVSRMIKSSYEISEMIASLNIRNPEQSVTYSAILNFFKHGDSEELTTAMLFDLMLERIPRVYHYQIKEGDICHYIVLFSDERNKVYAIDPLLGLLMPLEEYWVNDTFLSYFRSIAKNPKWKPETTPNPESFLECSNGRSCQNVYIYELNKNRLEDLLIQRDLLLEIFSYNTEMLSYRAELQRGSLFKDSPYSSSASSSQNQKTENGPDSLKKLLWVFSKDLAPNGEWKVKEMETTAWITFEKKDFKKAEELQKRLTDLKIPSQLTFTQKDNLPILLVRNILDSDLNFPEKIFTYILMKQTH